MSKSRLHPLPTSQSRRRRQELLAAPSAKGWRACRERRLRARAAALAALASLVVAGVGPTSSAVALRNGSSAVQGDVTIDLGAAATSPAQRTRFVETRVIGQSVQGRDIVAYRLGTPGGRAALVVGVIHGNEAKGELITERLRTMTVPAGVDLWVIDTINPDGQALGTRQNANRVDLNRNFERNWNYIPLSTSNNQHSGLGPADQPETAAAQAFIRSIQPHVSVWWHQASNRVSVGGARPEIPREYARLVGQVVADTPCTAGCTGTETQFSNFVVSGGTSFIVELPGNAAVTDTVVQRHADAVMAVVAM